MGQADFPRVEGAERVSSGVVDVKVPKDQERVGMLGEEVFGRKGPIWGSVKEQIVSIVTLKREKAKPNRP